MRWILTLRDVADALARLGLGMLSSLLLTVRAPMIVRWFGGEEQLRRWHHAVGLWACVVLLAHPAALAAASLPNMARAWNLLSPVRRFPANALGWAAVLGLVVGLTAPLLLHLRHTTWQRLHRCLSLAVLLGIAHAFIYRGLSAGLLLAAIPGTLALGWRVRHTLPLGRLRV